MNDSVEVESFTPCSIIDENKQNETEWMKNSKFLWIFFTLSMMFSMKTNSGKDPNISTSEFRPRLKKVISGWIYLLLLLELSTKMQDYVNGHNHNIVNIVEPPLLAITMFLATSTKQHGKLTKTLLHGFLLTLLGKQAVNFYWHATEVYNEDKGVSEYHTVFISGALLATFVSHLLFTLVAHGRGEEPKSTEEDSKQKTAEESASILSRITFSWLNDLLRRGNEKTLENKDLSELAEEQRAENAFSHLDPHWQKEFEKAKSANEKTKESENPNAPNDSKNDEKPEVNKVEGSVVRAIVIAFGVTYSYAVLIEIVLKLCEFSEPMVLKQLMKTVEDENQTFLRGVLFAVSLFVINCFRNLLGNQLIYHKCNLEYRLKAALMSSIYSKMLKMSHAARKSSTVGEIVNLMSVDAGRFVTMVHWFHFILIAPIQVFVAMYLLWLEMGSCAIAGFLAIAVFFPIHGLLGRKTRALHMKLSETKDSRIKLMNEILNGIKVMKLYTWEKSFEKKVQDIREKELSIMRKIKIYDSISTLVWNIGPFLVSLSTFALYVLGDDSHTLSVEKAFVSISIFHILSWSMSVIPHIMTGMNQGFISIKRINKFLNSEELDDDVISRSKDYESAISVKDASFSWDRNDAPLLKNINFEIPEGSLIAVVGSVGVGKSSLLSAMLGEMDKKSGNVNIKGTTAYVAQQAWIQNNTLKDNILFGRPYDKDVYENIIESCALGPDIDMLPGGHLAEIGEKGINLSGGQKQRVNMARAVYQDADIYLFDDPLSAVDSHVGKHIFNNVIGRNGVLKNKTRILVTHGVSFLPKVDKIITIQDGTISEMGTYEELKARSGAFAQFLKTYMKDDDSSDSSESENEGKGKSSPKKANKEKPKESSEESKKSPNSENVENDSKTIGEESVETGKVKFATFMSYLSNLGGVLCFVICLSFVIFRAADISSNFVLSDWTTDVKVPTTGHIDLNTTQNNIELEEEKYYRLGMYGAFGLTQAVVALIQALLIFLGGLTASRSLQSKMLRNILSSPMSFFDTNPVGRIVTRFSKDIDVVDWLAHRLKSYVDCISRMLTLPLLVGYNVPWFLVSLIPIYFLFRRIQEFHSPSSRQLKRLESANKSPMYTHFSESINGVSTIRAYQHQSRFDSEFRTRIDTYHKSLLSLINIHRWFGIRVGVLSLGVDLFVTLCAIFSRDILTAGVVALCITHTMNTTHTMNWFMHETMNTEEDLVAIERVNEFIEKPTEAPWEIEETKPCSSWPRSGKISIKDYQVRYREGQDLVLKGITSDIKPGEKVGIVGRTGSGKSTLTLALFRIIESAGGNITIDDVDISKIGLHDLRAKLTIIPQDPVIFSGTLRMNLDPFEQYSDEEIWTALEHAHLGKFVRSLPDKLKHECSEGGENLSVGQRQLICLARALLKKTKILILDEATAAVDMETDDLIQKTIRTEFADCTVLTIAHRLNTIMDYKRIMVLDKGKIAEFDSPARLLDNSDGIFYGMARDSNLV